MIKKFLPLLILAIIASCSSGSKQADVVKKATPFLWENANVYFLLTDRFLQR